MKYGARLSDRELLAELTKLARVNANLSRPYRMIRVAKLYTLATLAERSDLIDPEV